MHMHSRTFCILHGPTDIHCWILCILLIPTLTYKILSVLSKARRAELGARGHHPGLRPACSSLDQRRSPAEGAGRDVAEERGGEGRGKRKIRKEVSVVEMVEPWHPRGGACAGTAAKPLGALWDGRGGGEGV